MVGIKKKKRKKKQRDPDPPRASHSVSKSLQGVAHAYQSPHPLALSLVDDDHWSVISFQRVALLARTDVPPGIGWTNLIWSFILPLHWSHEKLISLLPSSFSLSWFFFLFTFSLKLLPVGRDFILPSNALLPHPTSHSHLSSLDFQCLIIHPFMIPKLFYITTKRVPFSLLNFPFLQFIKWN